ncbi:50S ribosomal protein L11 methyltransferase [Adhaeribacter sp. BT258]|uniref:Ribosomal protein L11 methyltransferase n=1 Tax=Adhaeribacter terrigena TaxID=2793070 RepID=A0ABS1C541_9BACT|nr:50S ribosomal protein L11 methyltransferase [Adhaeribacter terrigena]MBK0404474.1 50S ribosomal protein L11 methyltransferase [Adhaeribacter terrigena]
MDFIEVAVQAPQDFADILTAELSEIGYDTFMDTESGFNAYITEDIFSEPELQEVVEKYAAMAQISYATSKIAKQNWNEEWEKNFEPLIIGNQVSVRASFHPKPESVQYDIVINPKMTFGTGHHETTTLMIENQLTVDHKNKRVLDMGTGTGILAIMACKLGASEVVGVEVEDWSVENARENAELNQCPNIVVHFGDVTAVESDQPYDVVLANINRNVLLADMAAYTKLLKNGGPLVLSGFYTEDLAVLQEEATRCGLIFESSREKNNWVSAIFRKPLM